MYETDMYDNDEYIQFKGIMEPLKETDEVYVVSDGKVYKWDNSVVSVTDEYLAHFTEVSADVCPVFNTQDHNCDPTVSFIDIVEKEATTLKIKYESSSKNPFKTESFLLDHFINKCDLFPNNWEKVTLEDNITDIAEWVINVNKDIVIPLIPQEYRDLQDNAIYFKQVLVSVLTLSINDENINKLLTITKAVKYYCDKLKAAKESKKSSATKAEEKADES